MHFWCLPKSKMFTLSGILRYSTWPTKYCKNAISTVFSYSLDFHNTFHAFLSFHSIFEIGEALFLDLFQVLLYPTWKKAVCGGGGYAGIAMSLCPSLRVSVCQALSRRYLLNSSMFCIQTWYGGASSWASVSCERIGMLSSNLRSHTIGAYIITNMTVWTMSSDSALI